MRDAAARKNVEKNKYLELYKKSSLVPYYATNTGRFWDKKLFELGESVSTGNPMKNDRVRYLCNEVLRIAQSKEIKVLDVGFGEGLIEKKLSTKENIAFFGIDISRRAVENLTRSSRGTYVLGSVEQIPFSNNYFDLVIASEILEHIPPAKTFAVLFEVCRVLRRGGVLLVSVPQNEGLSDLVINYGINPNQHAREYSLNILRAELEHSGFTTYKIKTLFAFPDKYRLKTILAEIINRFCIKPKFNANNIIIFARKK